jgi:hypothetical protein
MKDKILRLADVIERIAFDIPAPNKWTPQFVELAVGIRGVAHALAAQHADARGGGVGEVTLPAPHRAYVTDDAVVVTGSPQQGWDEEGDSAHNCDANGCGQAHVLYRLPFTDERTSPEPPTAAAECNRDCDCVGECKAGIEKPTTDAGRKDAVEVAFSDWLVSQMPPGTVIGNPQWWAPRILRALRNLTPAGGGDGARLGFVLRRIQGTGLRSLVGVLSDTSDLSEFRTAIDAAIAAERGAGEG